MTDVTLVEPRWVIPIEPAGAVLESHAVVLRGERVDAVLPLAEAHARYRRAARVTLPTHALLPGLINLHTHAAMALLRGIADDLPLKAWLTEYIWPAEARHVSAGFVEAGTLLAAAEMLRGGTTCFHDMYFFPEAAARAAGRAGIRAILGLVILEFPTAYARHPDEYFARAREAHAALKATPRICCSVAPHAPYSVSDASFTRSVALAEEFDIPLHVHVHETEDEIAESLAEHGRRPLARLDALGVVTDRLIAAHCVHLEADERDLLADRGAAVAHCPAANLKLASGFAPVADLIARGITVGIGTDGAASNNRLDLWSEMRLAALVAKAVAGRADAVPAHHALAMVTREAARALRLDAELGSIAPGKQADLVAVDLGAPELQPCFDPVSHLVYAAGREHVTHVWVAGRPVVVDRVLQTVAVDEVAAAADEWGGRLGRGA
ncbi:MAG: TRZ/ATZ family hydrolase [Gemmatimonadota bacterium]|nr:TRZ/ATZ family hydrolase [Gemmatimonadota bacterium]